MKEYFYRQLTRRPINYKRLGRIADRLLTIICFVTLATDLFLICRRAAEIQRGGVGTLGGEYFIFLAPCVLYMIFKAVRDIVRGGGNG